MAKSQIERRVLQTETEFRVERNDDGRPTKLSGYAAPFNKEIELIEGLHEVIRPGAFARSLRESDDVRALFNHNLSVVLGRLSAGTLRLEETAKGLRYEVDLPDTQAARDLAVSVERGDITGSSIGFIARDEKMESKRDYVLRVITDAELIDVSVATFPAYEDTSVAVRCRQEYHDECEARKAVGVAGRDNARRQIDLVRAKIRA